MAMKSVLAVLGVLMFPASGVLAQPATSADTPDVPADVEERGVRPNGPDPLGDHHIDVRRAVA